MFVLIRKVVAAGLMLATLAAAGIAGLPTAASAQDQRLVLAIPQQPTTFQPYYFSVAFYHLYNQFYNVLVRLDQNQTPQPELATSWSLSDNGTELTLKLRDDVTFQTGRPFRAEDVKKSWEIATREDIQSNSRPLFLTIDHVEVIDDLTVKLVFKAPSPGMFDLLDQLWMVDADSFDKAETQPVGTGPFVLAEYLPGDRMTLKPYAGYWNKGKPALDEVEVRIVRDPQALILNLESGTVDAIGQVNLIDAARLESAGYKIVTASQSILYNVMFNNQSGLFAEHPLLHQVFVHATDRQRFNRIALAGKATPLCLPWIPTNFAYDAELDATCDFDLEKAKALMVEAGFPNGFDVTLYTSTDWYYGMTKLAEILQADLNSIGVRATIADVETAEYDKRHNGFGYDVIMSLTGRVNRDPSTMLNATSTMRAKDNAAGYNNPEYIALVAEASSTTDAQARRAIFDKINAIIRRDMYTMPVATSPFLFGYNAKLQNIRFSVDGFVFLEDVTIQ
jgi:ABC-type transport system substrate-binding protein